MLELHIWGPALSLPSVDAQCLAAISYLQLALPPTQWTIIPSSNPLLSPTKTLPALRHNSTWFSGLRPIISYLSQLAPDDSPDASLSPADKAALTAFASLVSTQGQAISDILFYVSTKNYIALTRPLFSDLLPWPVQYTIPPALRATAKARTNAQNLGFSLTGLDFENPDYEDARNKIRREFPINSDIFIDLVAPEAKTMIRLQEYCKTFFATLEEKLDGNRFFLGNDTPSSLDCLVLGYLSLFLYAGPLPVNFAEPALRGFPRLCAYVHEHREQFLGPEVRFADVKKGEARGLPWGKVERGDLPWVGAVVMERLRESWREVTGLGGKELEEGDKKFREEERSEWWKNVGMVAGGVVVFVGYMVWSGAGAILVENLSTRGEVEDDDEEEVEVEVVLE